MRNPDERRGDLRAQLAAHRLAEARVSDLCARRGRERVAAAMTELLAYSERVVRAAIRELPDGRYEGADLLETRAGLLDIRAVVTVDGDAIEIDFAGTAAAVRRKPQLPTRRHALGLLLRRALPDGAGPPRLRRRLRSGLGARTEGLARQRTVARGGRGREHGDVEPHHRRRVRRVLEGDSRAGAGSGDDEQRRRRQRPLRLLRDGRRRSGRLSRRGRAVGRPRRDVEHVQHAGGGARARVPPPRRAVRAALGLRRRGASPRRRRHRARAAHPRGLPALRCSPSGARSRRAARAEAATA